MSRNPVSGSDPTEVQRRFRARILGGSRPLLDDLSAGEMVAANRMIGNGEAKVDSYACRLFLIATADNDVVSKQ